MCVVFIVFIHCLLAQDRVPEERAVSDPPLLRLETEAAHAYLSVLAHLSLLRHPYGKGASNSNSNPDDPKMTLAEKCGASERMFRLCVAVLERYALGAARVAAAVAAAASGPGGPSSSAAVNGEMQRPGHRHHLSNPSALAAAAAAAAAPSSSFAAPGAAAAATMDAATASRQLLTVVGRTSFGQQVLLASCSSEYAPFSPLISSVLRALSQARTRRMRFLENWGGGRFCQ